MSEGNNSDHAGNQRPPVLALVINSVEELYEAYMPFLRHGGIFVPTDGEYRLGDSLFVLLDLRFQNERLPVSGTVVWISPGRGEGSQRIAGVGVQFAGKDAETLRGRIENLVGFMLESSRATLTM